MILLALLMSGCGGMSRMWAGISGYDFICIDGVQYIQFTSGVSVKFNKDGTISKCFSGDEK
jgi:hypothetical protein